MPSVDWSPAEALCSHWAIWLSQPSKMMASAYYHRILIPLLTQWRWSFRRWFENPSLPGALQRPSHSLHHARPLLQCFAAYARPASAATPFPWSAAGTGTRVTGAKQTEPLSPGVWMLCGWFYYIEDCASCVFTSTRTAGLRIGLVHINVYIYFLEKQYRRLDGGFQL